MAGYFKHNILYPLLMPIIIFAIMAAVIIAIGEVVLNLYSPGTTVDRVDRPELWFALGLGLIFLFGLAFLATRPEDTMGPLDRRVTIGNDGIFDEQHEVPVETVARGTLGTLADISPGYTLYAANGALATVKGMLPGSVDFGKTFRGFIYAEGLSGASDELWIPVEAVMSVYPDSESAFLAIKGDETEQYGWNVPPESMRRTPPRGTTSL